MQYPAHGGAKISGNPILCNKALGSQDDMATSDLAWNVAQGGTSRLATCAPTRPLSDFITSGVMLRLHPVKRERKTGQAVEQLPRHRPQWLCLLLRHSRPLAAIPPQWRLLQLLLRLVFRHKKTPVRLWWLLLLWAMGS